MSTSVATRSTPEDLLKITDRPMPELVDGELVEREPMGQKADVVASNIIHLLRCYSLASLPGIVTGAHGSVQAFPDDPNKVRIPDAAFTRRERLPEGLPFEGHGRVAPDLVVEIISPNDRAADLDAKIDDYQAAGVPLIWVVNPEIRTVRPYTLTGNVPPLHLGSTLTGGSVLPGFSCPVAAIFDGIYHPHPPGA
jgi:Uma2 family endonuclease